MRRCADSSRWHKQLGRFYVVDVRRNIIVAQHVSIEDLGRETGCLMPYEVVAEDEA